MGTRLLVTRSPLALALGATIPAALIAQRASSPSPGGENADGSLRPCARLTRLFTQDAYTEYTLLEPGSDKFRIRYLTEEHRPGATELVNGTRDWLDPRRFCFFRSMPIPPPWQHRKPVANADNLR